METPIEKYTKEHSSIPNKALDWVEKQTNIKTNYPRMLSGRITGELLTLIAKMINAHHILEIGCFTGYSTICLAEGIIGEGYVDSLEINDELESLIRQGWEKAGISNKARLHIGDAIESINNFVKEKRTFDMIYIDANKREYLAYYKAVMPLLKSGGVIIADDTMLGGKVYDTPLSTDKQTRGLLEFNDYVINDPGVELVMLPLRDGLSIIRKK